MEKDKNIEFVAKRYRRGAFDPQAAWRKLGIAPELWWRRRLRAAAAVTAAVVVSATATILYRVNLTEDSVPATPNIESVNVMAEVRVIDFENTPLPEVVAEIESVYGVKIDNLPSSPERFELSLHYEGTPSELISVINEILGTEMSVSAR